MAQGEVGSCQLLAVQRGNDLDQQMSRYDET